MGIPQHYSKDLPNRCYRLIEQLWPAVQQVHIEGEEHLGPLTTTFLLAMATPIITLPIERIERHRGRNAANGYVNDRPLDEKLSFQVDRDLGNQCVSDSPFFEKGEWRFANTPSEGQNFAVDFPQNIREKLESSESLEAAESMRASQWASCLRNALAHGGVSYLDSRGYMNYGDKAEIFAFVSAKYPKYPKGHAFEECRIPGEPPLDLRILRITEDGFRRFLQRWVEWLNETGLADIA